ncbi:hypothetical protein CS063_08370 [Sporanaerobium hydrogeniformans]|uniref:Uncharacterized protein n=1 Tax=Sporanaerobium hydrogeniformans TaxID=3072179 RepID=A0AC61DCP0_9FIRM|nr:DUF4179 domain-containing protein [Sporanaerobium hydrogeniformans]PHV70773.1 hypothetical protein CS063_08370 [Sporanaerobium hydrogeniformans]
MRLGKVRKELVLLLVASMLGCPVIQAQAVAEEKAVVTTSVQATGQSIMLDGQENQMHFIRTYGEPVYRSVVQDDLKMTLERVLADKHTMQLLISVEKLDGFPFIASENLRLRSIEINSKEDIEKQKRLEAIPKGAPYTEYIKVMAEFDEGLKAFIQEDNTLDMEGLSTYLNTAQSMMSGTSSASYGMCYTKENTDSKVYFTYKGRYGESVLGDIIVSIEGIEGEEEKTYPIAVNLTDYLMAHKGEALKLIPHVLEDHEKKHLERLKDSNEELYLERKKELEGQPQMLLDEAGLGLQLIEGDNRFTIDNIGFIQDKLHILMAGEGKKTYDMRLYDKTGEMIESSYQVGSSHTSENETIKNTAYWVYDIASPEELKAYQFQLTTREVVENWQGPWEFEVENKGEVKTLTVNQIIPYGTEKEINVREIQIGKGSMALVLDRQEENQNAGDITPKLKVILKDGKEILLNSSEASSLEKDKMTLIYSFRDWIGTDIASVEVGDIVLYKAYK